MTKRKVILHYHIFKNAGTSIDRMLQASLGNRWANFDRTDSSAKISPEEMEAYILDHPDLLAVSSHHAVPPLPDRHLHVYPIILLRHPVDRAYSAYLFEWKKQQNTTDPIGTFADYIREKFRQPRRNAIEDFQTLHLANRSYTHRLPSAEIGDEKLLSNARTLLREAGCFGIVDRFSESLKLMTRRLGPVFPEVKWNEYQENRLQEEGVDLSDKMKNVISMLDHATYTQLVMRNQLDLRLYENALGRFDHMIRKDFF